MPVLRNKYWISFKHTENVGAKYYQTELDLSDEI